MSTKAKGYLILLLVLFAMAVFIGLQFYKEGLQSKALESKKAQLTTQLNQITDDTAAKQKNLDDSKSDPWAIQQGHELGMVLPGEVKIVDKDK